MKIDGGCHCGQITYEAEADPDKVGICHCTDCQTLSGSAFRTFVFVPGESFRLVSGTPKIYHKIGESGATRVQAFCGDCGAPIYSSSTDAAPEAYSIRLGTVRQRDELVPKMQIWCRSAQSWLPEIDSISKNEVQ